MTFCDHTSSIKVAEVNNEDYLSPPVSSDFKHIPDHFLDTYQKNFHIFVFTKNQDPTLRFDYTPIIKFEILELVRPPRKYFSMKIGGKPDWQISNDFPSDYMGNKFAFLLQILNNFEFELNKIDNASFQKAYSWSTGGTEFRTDGKYLLFGGVSLYFFGTLDNNNPQVYVMNQ